MTFTILYKAVKMSDLECFKSSIDQSFHLKNIGCVWQVKEGETTIKFRASKDSFGFSLDKGAVKNRFGFFPKADEDRLEHIAKICDGIIISQYKQGICIFLIELKSNYSGDYKKQLTNGYLFCQWLLALLKEYEYFEEKVKFVGLLHKSIRSNKQTSRHQPKLIKNISLPYFSIFQISQSKLLLHSFL